MRTLPTPLLAVLELLHKSGFIHTFRWAHYPRNNFSNDSLSTELLSTSKHSLFFAGVSAILLQEEETISAASSHEYTLLSHPKVLSATQKCLVKQPAEQTLPAPQSLPAHHMRTIGTQTCKSTPGHQLPISRQPWGKIAQIVKANALFLARG